MWKNPNPGKLEALTLAEIAIVGIVMDDAADDVIYSEVDDRHYSIVDLKNWLESSESPGEYFDSLISTVRTMAKDLGVEGFDYKDVIEAAIDLAERCGAIAWQDDLGFWNVALYDWRQRDRFLRAIRELSAEEA